MPRSGRIGWGWMEEGSTGGWGPRAPAGRRLGPFPCGWACSNSPPGTAAGAHTTADPCTPSAACASTTARGVAVGKFTVSAHLHLRTGPGDRRPPPGTAARAADSPTPRVSPWHRQLTQRRTRTLIHSLIHSFVHACIDSADSRGFLLCGLGQVSCPLRAVKSPIRQRSQTPTMCQLKVSGREAGQEAQGRGSRRLRQHNGCGSSTVSPESSGISLSPTHGLQGEAPPPVLPPLSSSCCPGP